MILIKNTTIFAFLKNKNKMHINFQKNNFIVFLFLLSFSSVTAQDKNDSINHSIKKIIDFTETIYGTDDILVSGQPYLTNLNKVKKGHPFFGNNNWWIENLTINEITYKNVQLKYDIENDKLILNATYDNDISRQLILSNNVIDSFNIQGHNFINSKHITNKAADKRYYELIYKGDFFFLIKHSKILNSAYYSSPPFGKYSNTLSVKYIFDNGTMKRLNNKRSFIKYFEKHKKKIRKFMRKNKIKYKKATKNELWNLLEYCNNLTNN